MLKNAGRFAVIVGLCATCALSQTAQLTGTVTDPTGAVVAAAKVTATNIETGVARNAITNGVGNYLITALLPGKYRVSSEAPGFKVVVRDTVNLAVDQVG